MQSEEYQIEVGKDWIMNMKRKGTRFMSPLKPFQLSTQTERLLERPTAYWRTVPSTDPGSPPLTLQRTLWNEKSQWGFSETSPLFLLISSKVLDGGLVPPHWFCSWECGSSTDMLPRPDPPQVQGSTDKKILPLFSIQRGCNLYSLQEGSSPMPGANRVSKARTNHAYIFWTIQLHQVHFSVVDELLQGLSQGKQNMTYILVSLPNRT